MTDGFPFKQVLPATAVAALTGTVNATTLVGPFTPELIRNIYLQVACPTAATGSVTLLRSADGGVTKYQMTVMGQLLYNWNLSATTGVVVNEEVDCPNSNLLTYYLQITLTAGSVSYNIYQ